MSNIKGTIVNVKDFLALDAVNIRITGASESIFTLEEGRSYVIPDFQREIRWTPENLIELMNDIFHQSKFLGNIILTRSESKRYAIIDTATAKQETNPAGIRRRWCDHGSNRSKTRS